MNNQFNDARNRWLAHCASLCVLSLSLQGLAQAPDLTAAGVIAGIDTTYTYNLGPTGMRGWLYRAYNWPGGRDAGAYGLATWEKPWQILVTTVGTNTPAYGILAANDVLLGVSTGEGTSVQPFTADARKSIGWAIGAAEAGDGVMNLKRWRAGVTTDVSIQLQVMGAYSATAPFNCPKSALILSNACAIIANQAFNAGGPGNPVLGLALLASGKPELVTKAQEYANAIAPANLSLDPTACDTWGWGYKNVFLSEYYLLTGDTNVLHGINEYAVNLAKAQSMYGTFGHGGSQLTATGGYHGSISWYGPVNQAGLIGNMGIVMGRKALVAAGLAVDDEIDPAIGRAANFFGYFVGKGGIPYGEHEPGNGHNSNGKDSSTALMFALMGNQPKATEFFTRMSVAGYDGREYGHTGQGFSYLWSALGAHVGGTNALASYLAPVRWHLDLSRRCNGTFVYDGGEQYGGSELYDYWGSATYAGIDPTATYVLTYSIPKQQLYITGKNADPTNWLSSSVVSNAIWAGAFIMLIDGYNTSQLIAAMGEYDPVVRSWAADAVGKTNVSVSVLTNMACSANSLLREAACQALGVRKDTTALTVLGQRLTDPDIWVRSKASKALQNFGSAALPQLATMLVAFTNNATDPHVIVWDDPIQISNGYLAEELFETLGSSTINAETNLLYSAVRAGLHQPDGMARMYLSDFIQNRLSLTHVQAVAPSLIAAVSERSPADQMFSDVIRYAGLKTLAKYKIEEGIPLCLMVKEQTWHGDDWVPFDYLANTYRGAARDALPTLYAWQAHLPQFDADGSIPDNRYANIESHIASTIAAIENDASPPTLYTFKKITSARALPSGVALPSASNVLSVAVSDTDNGVPAFSWSKVSGAGNVSFTPGGITQSTNCMASFDTAGTYILRVAVVDSSILNSGLWVTHNLGYYDFQTYTNVIGAVFTNVTVTVSPDANRAPVSQNQSLATPVNTAKAVTLAALDSNGDTLTFSIVTPPAHGALSGTVPNVTYTPTTSYTGFDSFTFKANDGRVDSDGATVTIDVGVAGNRRPVATNQLVTVVEDTAKVITLTGNDPDSDPLTYTILSLPANGTLSGSPPAMTYTPATNYPAGNVNGSDSLTFVVSDGALTSAVATVSIVVTPVNDPPQALAQSKSVPANIDSVLTLTGSDPEGYALSYAVASTPSHGVLSGVAPDLTYQPVANYHGPDSFTFRVTDSEGSVSSAATVSITVINAPPVANPQSVEVTPNIAKAITLTGSDNCNDTLTYTVLTQPVNGVLSGTAPSVTYTPASNYTGADSFTFKVNDGTQDSVSPAIVTVNVVQWQSWTNIASGNWSVGGNWAGGTAPSAGGGADHQLFFNTGGYSGASVNNLSGTFQLNRLTFGSSLPAVTLSGNELALTNQAAISPQLLQNSANAVVLSTPLGLNANTTIEGAGAGTVSLSGVIGGAGSLTKTVGGTLTLSSANTFSGGLAVNAGTLNPHGNGSGASRAYFGTGTTTLTNGITLQATDVSGQPVRMSTAFYLSGGMVSVPIPFGGGTDLRLDGTISGPGGLFIYGGTRGLTLNGNNTFSGGVTLNDGNNVSINNVNGLGTGPLMSGDATGGILRPSTSLSAGWVTNRIVLAFGGTLTVDTGSGSLRLSGNISDSGGLTKSGANTLTLSGVNTYSGPTHVAGGTLVCSTALALGSGTLDISTGAKLQLDYTGTRPIDALTFNNGTALPNGSYGSSSSPAANTNNTYFSGTGTVTVGATSQTITFGVLPAKIYGDAPFALTATASSGLAISYESSDPTVASVSGNIVTILKVGATTITASQEGNGSYDMATPVARTLTVNKAGQTITFGALASKTYGDAPFALTATASSGLDVSYASTDPAVASISGNIVTIWKVGSTTLTASQAGNANYEAATPMQQPLTVNPLAVALSGTRIYDGTTTALAADLSITNTIAGDSLTLSGNATLTGKNAGQQTVVSATGVATPARVQSATGTTGASAAITLTVTLGVTPVNGNTLVAVISTRGTSADRVTSISGGGVTWSRASQAANANGTTTEIWYGPNVASGTTAITINQASLRSAAVVKEYSGILSASPLDQSANATGSSASAATGTTPATTQASELWVGGIGLSGSAYTLGSVLNNFASITNAQSSSGIAADNAKVYALECITNAMGLAASGGALSGTQTAVIAQRGSATTATTATTSLGLVVPSGVQVGDLLIANIANYQGTAASISAPGTWTATSAAGTLTVATKRGALFYRVATSADTSAPTYTFTVAAGGTAPGAAGAIVAFSGVDAASPFDVAPGALSTGNVTAASATTITTLSANAAVVMFGMQARSTSGNAARTWLNQNTGAPGSLTLTELYDAAQTGNGNFHPGVMAAWAIKAVAGDTGAGAATLSGNVNYGLVLCALKPATMSSQWSGAIATFKSASTSSLTLSGAASTNYTLTGMSGTMIVNAKPLLLSGAGVANKIYDATVTATLTNGTLLASEAPGAGDTSDNKPYTGDAVGVTLSAVFDTKDAGINKAVTSTSVLTGAQAGNYTLTQPTGLIATVTPKALAVTGAAIASKFYDGTTNALFSAGALLEAEVAGGGTSVDNKPYTGDAVTLNLSGMFASKNVGTGIPVTSTSSLTGAQKDNYALSQPTGLTSAITPVSLTVTANNQSKTFGQSLTFGSGSTLFTSSGLQNSETIESVTLTCAGGGAGAAIGIYPITPSAATGGTFSPANYDITYTTSGTLTVNLTGQTISFGALAAKTYGDAPFGLIATASSGLTVSYESADPSVASVSGSTVTILKAGSTVITATQAGDVNVGAATPVQQTLTINPATQTITFGPLADKTYGDAPFELTATASSGLTVSYTSSDTNVAIVVSNLVTILNAGGTTIIATQAGDANRNAAEPVMQTFTVNKAGQTISFGALAPKTYGDVPFELGATASSGLTVSYENSDTNVAIVVGSTVTSRKVGSTVITATQAGDANRSAADPVPQTLTVGKATPVLTWDIPAAIKVGTALSSNQLNAASGGVAGTFTYTPPAGTVLPVGAGQTLRVRFTPADTETYNSPADKKVSITVTAFILAEDFEHEWADNAVANTTNGWVSLGTGDLSSITNPAVGYDRLPDQLLFPLIYDHSAQKRVLSLNTQGAMLTTPVLDAGFATAKVHIDMMAKFSVSGEMPVAVSNDALAKASLFLYANGAETNLVVFHGQKTPDGFGAPAFTEVTSAIDPDAWFRLTITFDATTNNTGAEAFCVRINGKPVVSPVAYRDNWKTRLFTPSCEPDNGIWFLSAARRQGTSGASLNTISNLCFVGTGFVDDLVVTPSSPTFTPGTVIMLALSTGRGGEAWMGF